MGAKAGVICYAHTNLMRLEDRAKIMPNSPSPPLWRFGWLLSCVVLLAGCGDVQGADGAVLTLDGRGSSYLAYQDGMGVWQPLGTSLEGTLNLTLTDTQGRYGVMNLCLDEVTGNLTVNVRHALLSEAARVAATCSSDTVPADLVSVSGQVKGFRDGEYGNVYLGDASVLVDSSAPEHRLELPSARYDLIATRYTQDERVPSRMVVGPGVEALGKSPLVVDFAGPDAFTPQTATLPLVGVRPDELLSGSVEVVTQTGTVALLGEYLGGRTLRYARIPETKLRGAVLRAAAQSFSYNDQTKAGSSRSVTRTFAGDAAPLALPQPLAEPTLSVRTDAVRPQARWHAHPAGPGTYAQFYLQLQGELQGGQAQGGRSVSYRLSQSSGWLSGRPYSYTLPDFSTLPEWQEAWDLRRAEALFWEVSFSRTTETSTHFASRSGVLTP